MTQHTKIERPLVATSWTWSGNTGPGIGDESSPADIVARIEAISRAGYMGAGFTYGDLVKLRDTLGLETLSSMLTDHGIHHVELEFLYNWWADGPARQASDRARTDLFAAAAPLNVRTIKVGAQIDGVDDEPRVDADRFARELDSLGNEAAARGLRVAIEPMPMANLADVTSGAKLLAEIDNPAVGLVIDLWHVVRAGTRFDEMESALDVESIFVVELDDVAEVMRGSLWNDTINNRPLPGRGVGRPHEFIAALHRMGWRGPWGVEIIDEEYRALPVDDAVKQTFEATMLSFDRAEILLATASSTHGDQREGN